MTTERANHKWWTLFAMCFALFMIMLDNTIVNVALPSIQRDLHMTISSLEWVVTAYALTFAALLITGGKLGDYYGRRRMFILGLVVFSLASLAGHTGVVWSVALSGDGQLAVSGGDDGMIRLWDTSSGAALRMLRSDRNYQRLDITGLTGVTQAQRAALLALGAIDQTPAPAHASAGAG